MTSKIEYICDKCKVITASRDNFWTVDLGYKSMSSQHYTSRTAAGSLDYCRDCMIELGFLCGMQTAEDRDKPKPQAAPSIEDFIREIVQEEIANNAS